MAQKIRFVNADKSEFFPEVKRRVDAYFEERNLSRHGNGLMVFKLVFYLVVLFGSLGTLLFVPVPVGVQYGLWAIIGFFAAFCGLGICHDAIHGSLFRNQKLNQALGYLFNVLGANAYIWDIMHNKVHHTYTNIEGHDEDLESVPFLRMSPHKKLKKIHRIQHFLALPVYGLASISWVFFKDYVKFTRKQIGQFPTPRHPVSEWVKLFVGKAIYYTLFIVLPVLLIDVAWYHIVLGFMLMHYAEGITLAVIFMLAHVVEETHYPLPDEDGKVHRSWAVHQMYTTANFAVDKPVATFFCGGLNFQVEHHLFPKVSHVHLPAISRIVRQTAQEYGIPYIAHPTVLSALRSHLRLLKHFGRSEGGPEYQPREIPSAA